MYKNVVMSVTKAMRYRDVPKVFGHCDFLLYISCKTIFFKKHYSKVDPCSILMIFLPTKTELNVILHCNFSINL